MENQDQTMPTTSPVTPTPAASSVPNAATPATQTAPNATTAEKTEKPRVAGTPKISNDVFVRKITEKIKTSENILVALSRDPSVDEIAAAIGLTLFLDSLQKHTTAIYSGATPDALQFLQPEGTFETNTDGLRDFIIALNKEKADHLRYKLDGDFVKVFITPYKTNITEEDLEFSHGDFNVNLVLALGVPSAADLDSALAEHGRIMHDATTVDITIDVPGKFGEIEWSDPASSSVSEMVTKVIFALQGDDKMLDKETATALLTGIVAATARFSNERTNSDTMELASRLMAMGADQQLISAHVLENDSGAYYNASMAPRTDLAISHETFVDNGPAIAMDGAVVMPAMMGETTPVEAEVEKDDAKDEADFPKNDGPSQAELAAAASAAVNEAVAAAAANAAAAGAVSPTANAQPQAQPQTTAEGKSPKIISGSVANQIAQPQAAQAGMINPLPTTNEQKNYAQMLEQALAEPSAVSARPYLGATMTDAGNAGAGFVNGALGATASANPAAQVAPAEVSQGPEPVAKPSGVTLPPPPTPMVEADMMPPKMPGTSGGSDAKAGGAANANAPTAATRSDAFQIPGAN